MNTDFTRIRHRSVMIGICVALLIFLLLGVGYGYAHRQTIANITNFSECLAAGNPAMESSPRQCITKDGVHFTEELAPTPTDTENQIRVATPASGSSIASPLTITGEARGSWFSEARFPIYVVDWDGFIIGEGFATAQEEWMTSEFVPFTAVITFDTNMIRGNYSNRGTLILRKDNPSGLPENDDAIEIPVLFANVDTTPPPPEPAGKGTVNGTVSLSPTCPVEQDPPEPGCSPKPYATTIRISSQGVPYATITTNSSGQYTTALPAGTYVFLPKSGADGFPRCSETQVTVAAGTVSIQNLDCDTGIR